MLTCGAGGVVRTGSQMRALYALCARIPGEHSRGEKHRAMDKKRPRRNEGHLAARCAVAVPEGADFVLYPEEEQSAEEEEEESNVSDEDEDEDEDDEDDDKLEELPLALFLYADEIIEETTVSVDYERWKEGAEALGKAKMIFYAFEPEIKTMVEKASRRGNDGKVPPGSALVRRSLKDKRFLLCSICIAQAKIAANLQLDLTTAASISFLREALVLFPRSVEALLLLAMSLKPLAATLGELREVEELLRKAAVTKAALISAEAPAEEDRVYTARDVTAADTAQQALALLLCQSGRSGEASKHLLAQKFTWRLSDQVLDYPLSASTMALDANTDSYIQAFDNVFPAPVMNHLQHAFRPSSPFWSEHHYDITTNSSRKVGYFSYLYPLKARQAASSVEQVIDMVYAIALEKFPAVRDCSVCEWWVHSRPHPSGHQLHFDSDETKIEDGGSPHHPICSSVLYITEGDAIGGPTLMTDQTLASGTLAEKGWLCHPKHGRLCLFDAKHLHGVIPGKGVSPDPKARRLTFMVGFWMSISARNRGLDEPGAGQPFPTSDSKYTWPAEVALQQDGFLLNAASVQKVEPIQLSDVWEPIEAATGESLAKRPTPCYGSCFQGF